MRSRFRLCHVSLVLTAVFTVGCGSGVVPAVMDAVNDILSSDAPLDPVDSVSVPGVGQDSQSPGAQDVVPIGFGSDTHTTNTTGSGSDTQAPNTAPRSSGGSGILPALDVATSVLTPVTYAQGPPPVSGNPGAVFSGGGGGGGAPPALGSGGLPSGSLPPLTPTLQAQLDQEDQCEALCKGLTPPPDCHCERQGQKEQGEKEQGEKGDAKGGDANAASPNAPTIPGSGAPSGFNGTLLGLNGGGAGPYNA